MSVCVMTGKTARNEGTQDFFVALNHIQTKSPLRDIGSMYEFLDFCMFDGLNTEVLLCYCVPRL